MMEDTRQIVLVVLLFGVLLYAWYRWRHVVIDALTPKPKRCPKCGDVLLCDPQKYKHTLFWVCQGCQETYETLRQ